MIRPVAYLFPAFGMRYRGPLARRPIGFEDERDRLLAVARGIVAVDVAEAGLAPVGDPLSNSLREHYLSYVDSCALAAVVARSGVPCALAAGYSMGLFAALAHCGALSFEDGLHLIEHVVRVAHDVVDERDYGMGAVIGLDLEMVETIVCDTGPGVEVADVSAEQVIVLAGLCPDVDRALAAATGAGALYATMLPIVLPFHSSWMAPAGPRIREFLPRLRIRAPRCRVVSAVDQVVMTDAAAVARELAQNIVSPLHWLRTMQVLVDAGVGTVVECGFSESLCKFAKGLEPAPQVYHPKVFGRLVERASLVA
jgi:[acyl-carrier-protein] S-malonyltransferase